MDVLSLNLIAQVKIWRSHNLWRPYRKAVRPDKKKKKSHFLSFYCHFYDQIKYLHMLEYLKMKEFSLKTRDEKQGFMQYKSHTLTPASTCFVTTGTVMYFPHFLMTFSNKLIILQLLSNIFTHQSQTLLLMKQQIRGRGCAEKRKRISPASPADQVGRGHLTPASQVTSVSPSPHFANYSPLHSVFWTKLIKVWVAYRSWVERSNIL